MALYAQYTIGGVTKVLQKPPRSREFHIFSIFFPAYGSVPLRQTAFAPNDPFSIRLGQTGQQTAELPHGFLGGLGQMTEGETDPHTVVLHLAYFAEG